VAKTTRCCAAMNARGKTRAAAQALVFRVDSAASTAGAIKQSPSGQSADIRASIRIDAAGNRCRAFYPLTRIARVPRGAAPSCLGRPSFRTKPVARWPSHATERDVVVPGGSGRMSGPTHPVAGSRAKRFIHVDFRVRDPWPSN